MVNKANGSRLTRHFTDMIWRPLIQSPARSSVALFIFLSLIVVAILSTRFSTSPIVASSTKQSVLTGETIGSSSDSNSKTIQPPDTAHTGKPIVDSSTKQTPLIGEPIASDPDSQIDVTQPNVDSSTKETLLTGEPIASDPDSQNKITKPPERSHTKLEIPLKCFDSNITQTCPRDYPERVEVDPDAPTPPTCPDYFRWIHEDLRPWRETGITRKMVESAKRTANFRLVIVNGRAYVERYKNSYQTRDVFTLWGILQLLRKYPGRVPDLDLMFDCVDWPVISKFHRWNDAVPPLFRYCKDDSSLDIIFPDWSFWGWAEINLKPWELLSKELQEGNTRMRFGDREPYAYWKGNPFVAPTRMDLLKCNVSEKQDWGARVFVQDWFKEGQQGFKQSNLASQCVDKYKIYIEGSAWSVSEKYILACDSVTLIVKPRYYDFFSRGLMPVQNYWPIREDDKCRSIKFAVEWLNSHKQKAQAIGKAASDYIHEDVKMDYVYDYMLHLLTEYAKLFKYKPTIPPNAVELCSETTACPTPPGYEKLFMMQSVVTSPSDTGPCTLPPPYDRVALQTLVRRKNNAVTQVENWEKNYWMNQTTHQ